MRKKRWDEKALLSADPTQGEICPSQPGGDPGTQRAAGESGELFEGAEQGPPSSWPYCRRNVPGMSPVEMSAPPGFQGKLGTTGEELSSWVQPPSDKHFSLGCLFQLQL